MVTKEKEIKLELEEIIIRLEETRNNALEMRESNEMGLQVNEFNGNYEEDMESVESAFFEFGNFIDEIIQVISEELDNLRNLLERMDGPK